MVLDFKGIPNKLFPHSQAEDRGIGAKPIEKNWSCNGSNFFDSDGSTVLWDISGIWTTGDNGVIALANVSGLPDGAIVTEVIVYGNAGATAETWSLYRMPLTGPPAVLMASTNIGTIDKSISNEQIDYSKYTYYINTSTMDNGDEIYGAKITYII